MKDDSFTFAGIYRGSQGRNEVGQSVKPQVVVAGPLTIIGLLVFRPRLYPLDRASRTLSRWSS